MAKFSQRNKRHILIVVSVIVVIAVVIAVAIPLALRDRGGDDDNDDDDASNAYASKGSYPNDCFPEAEGDPSRVNELACRSRGCQFDAKVKDTPVCHYTEDVYRLKVTEVMATELGLTVKLEQVGSAPFGGDVANWLFRFENRGENVARFTFDTEDGKRYKVPKVMNLQVKPTLSPEYEMKITNNDSFAFQITRIKTGTVIWDSTGLVLSDQFLQAATRLPSANVYGLGEQRHETLRHELTKTWPAFSRDQPPSFDDEANLYGVHPFYTCVEDKKGNSHGVLLLNSNAQEYAFSSMPSLTFRTIGGILDFYLFLGPTPENVIQQYTGVIGRPFMPPYWSLGFQLCRYGYNNMTNLKNAVQSTAQYDIPHDVQYVDIDHMVAQKTFTVDEERFPGLNSYFEQLRDEGMRIIYILDPCLQANETDYSPYNALRDVNGYITWKDPSAVDDADKDETGAMLGYVWPKGKVTFPDFMKTKTQEGWKRIVKDHWNTLVYDGLWIDMNEPANFGTNEDRPWNWPEEEKPYWSLRCPKDSLEDPPYRTKVASKWDTDSRQGRLSDKTLCMGGVHGDNGQYRHYDVHSLYGWSQSKPTLEGAREATGERSVVISRSTFPGSGQYAGHWLGDNVSHWKDMHRSIIGMLEFNMFGIPYIGADICGFFEDTTPELCKRWMQLGAFYTFSRNHNTLGAKAQGPGQLGDEVGNASRDVMRVRYRLLPYLYFLFSEAHQHGSTVIRPLHHEFPTDQTALSVDKQFLWGSCLLISPILEQGQTELAYYLPKGKWFNYFTRASEVSTEGVQKKVSVDTNSMPLLHLRGGCIIVEQEYANNTHFSRQKPLSILAALDEDKKASGGFYWDDGVSIDPVGSKKYYKAEIVLTNSSLRLTTQHKPVLDPSASSSPTHWEKINFDKVVVLGVEGTVKSVKMKESSTAPEDNLDFTHSGEVLQIDLGLGEKSLTLFDGFEVIWES